MRLLQAQATLTLGSHCRGKGFFCKAEANFYRVLALESQNVGFDAIKRAYRTLVLRYHPDVCPPGKREESTKMFLELQKAYETLSDPIMREEYDHMLSLEVEGRWRKRENTRFCRQTWRNQLEELAVRSAERMTKEEKKNTNNGEL